MLKHFRQGITYVLMTTFSFLSLTHSANASLITTQQFATEIKGSISRAPLNAALDRPDVQAQLEALGVSRAAAEQRIASLTDQEVIALNNNLDSLPAGAGIVGALVFVFVLLLVTDILGLTKVYSFTKPVN